jgi:uncharacterized protein (DUF302 family)
MEIYGRRVVVDMPIDAAITELTASLHDEGFTILSRVNVRQMLAQTLQADFRQYVLLEVALPHVVREALREDVGVGVILPTTIAVFELADGETAIAVADPFAGLTAEADWRRSAPHLAALADETCDRLAAALEELQQDARAFTAMRAAVTAP